jgi:hypothetical protein
MDVTSTDKSMRLQRAWSRTLEFGSCMGGCSVTDTLGIRERQLLPPGHEPRGGGADYV